MGGSPAFAATNDTITVTVNISSVAEITVLPTSLSWTAGSLGAITPGTDSGVSTVIIKNTGSVNVTNLYLNTSTISEEINNPLSTSNASYYSSAGFIFVRNSTNTNYFHAGRLEWNLSSVMTSEVLNFSSTTSSFGHGWYKNASNGNEYLWKVENGTGGLCNATNAFLTVKTVPENTTLLNRDLSVNTVTCGVIGTSASNWGSFACTNGPLAGHCVASYYDCSKIFIYKYNKVPAAELPACSNAMALQESALTPGAETSMQVFASVPKGTPAGTALQGTLTILAS